MRILLTVMIALCGMAVPLLPLAPALAQQNPLFFGEWEAGFPEEEHLRHKIIEPGRIYVEKDGEIISDLRYRVVRDFGTHIVIVSEWVVNPLAKALSRHWLEVEGQPPPKSILKDSSYSVLALVKKFDGFPQAMVWWDCSGAVATYVLDIKSLEEYKMDEVWRRIRLWSDDPDRGYDPDLLSGKHICRIKDDGMPWGWLGPRDYDPDFDRTQFPDGPGWGAVTMTYVDKE